MEQKILRTNYGEWVQCTWDEYQPNDPENFMFSYNNDTAVFTYYKRVK